MAGPRSHPTAQACAAGTPGLRWLQRPLAASSVSWLSPSAFSRGQYIGVGLTFVGIVSPAPLSLNAAAALGPFHPAALR